MALGARCPVPPRGTLSLYCISYLRRRPRASIGAILGEREGVRKGPIACRISTPGPRTRSRTRAGPQIEPNPAPTPTQDRHLDPNVPAPTRDGAYRAQQIPATPDPNIAKPPGCLLELSTEGVQRRQQGSRSRTR